MSRKFKSTVTEKENNLSKVIFKYLELTYLILYGLSGNYKFIGCQIPHDVMRGEISY